MKRNFLFLLLAIFSLKLSAQPLLNKGFEDWHTDTSSHAKFWIDPNFQAFWAYGKENVTQSSDAISGSSVRMETFMTPGVDTIFGFVSYVEDDPTTSPGGQPYIQKPDTMFGYAKFDVVPGDTAFILVTFKLGGIAISTDLYPFTGTQSTWQSFSFVVSPPSIPDTMIIAAASGNAFSEIGIANGSWLMLDELSFNTSNPIPGGDFDVWTSSYLMNPDGWSTPNFVPDTVEWVSRSTDKYAGDYAVKIKSGISYWGDTTGWISSGQLADIGIRGGRPYTQMIDTLAGYYKYIPAGTDTSEYGIVLSNSGTVFQFAYGQLAPTATYKYFELPFAAISTPDTIRVDFIPTSISHNPGALLGSQLFLDEVHLKSDPLVSIIPSRELIAGFYPNPAKGQFMLEFISDKEGNWKLVILDISGKRVIGKNIHANAGLNRSMINTEQLDSGLYFLQLTNGNQSFHGKIKIEK